MRRVGLLTIGILLGSAALLYAQRRGGRFGSVMVEPSPDYNGRFSFVRLRYQWIIGRGWEYDYPAMERHLMYVVKELTSMKPHTDQSVVVDMDDPALFRYSVAYLSEPGFWLPSDAEAAGLRKWLAKGGFLIVDDFYGNQWQNFERSMRRVLPGLEFAKLDKTHPIFNSFYSIDNLEGMSHPASQGFRAVYYGIYENNDRRRRLVAIVNYNNDIGDYMEWSGQGWYPMNMSNDAYKFATNYIVYGLTH